jgi:DNA-binding NtrC family response regulator
MRVNVLVVSACNEDLAWFEVVLQERGWKVRCAQNLTGAMEFIRMQHAVVVISEPTLPDGDWKQLLSQLIDEGWPTALVVFSHLADERLWSEVLHLGGYDVLPRPVDKDELFRTVALAWEQCKRKCHDTRTETSGRSRPKRNTEPNLGAEGNGT